MIETLEYELKELEDTLGNSDKYKSENIVDRFGNELKILDIVLTSRNSGKFSEYLITRISKHSIFRIPLNSTYGYISDNIKESINLKELYANYFNYSSWYDFTGDKDMIIIDEKYLSERGKKTLDIIRNKKWFDGI